MSVRANGKAKRTGRSVRMTVWVLAGVLAASLVEGDVRRSDAAPVLTASTAASASAIAEPMAPTVETSAWGDRRDGRASVDRGVKVLVGAEARRYVQARRAKDDRLRRAFDRSASVLRRKGWRRTDEVVVVRSPGGGVRRTNDALPDVRPNGRPPGLRPVDHPARDAGTGTATVEDMESNRDGEIWFLAWDDGNPATWEGEVYLAAYGLGSWRVSVDQYDVSADAFLMPLWQEVVMGYPDDPFARDPWQMEPIGLRRMLPAAGRALSVSSASVRVDAVADPWRTPSLRSAAFPMSSWMATSGRSCARGEERTGVQAHHCGCPSGYFDRVYGSWGRCESRERWLCNIAGCAGGTTTCVFSGPLTFRCVLARCAGVAVACGLAQLFRYYGACGIIW